MKNFSLIWRSPTSMFLSPHSHKFCPWYCSSAASAPTAKLGLNIAFPKQLWVSFFENSCARKWEWIQRFIDTSLAIFWLTHLGCPAPFLQALLCLSPTEPRWMECSQRSITQVSSFNNPFISMIKWLNKLYLWLNVLLQDCRCLCYCGQAILKFSSSPLNFC